MSLREPKHRRSPDYTRAFLDQLQRELHDKGRKDASFVELCDRASIPRDLRVRLMNSLLSEKYVTRNGDQVSITPLGTKMATAPLV
jgi:DNA-binding IclR family transcriptional regulator